MYRSNRLKHPSGHTAAKSMPPPPPSPPPPLLLWEQVASRRWQSLAKGIKRQHRLNKKQCLEKVREVLNVTDMSRIER